MQVRLAEYMLTMVETDIGEEVERGDPAFFSWDYPFLELMNWCMQVRLAEYMLTMVEPDIGEEVERGEPAFFGGNWSPGWCNTRP
jgi:hypothetical protein